jgi:aspartyl-tRNA(Asn)/glutamyl-tRNA(Gln) amidotransferase subunit C
MIDVHKVATLARLQLSKEEENSYQPQLNEIFKYFEEISQIDTKNVEPMITPSEIELVFREDKIEITQSPEESLSNAPERSGNLFKVPPVV